MKIKRFSASKLTLRSRVIKKYGILSLEILFSSREGRKKKPRRLDCRKRRRSWRILNSLSRRRLKRKK